MAMREEQYYLVVTESELEKLFGELADRWLYYHQVHINHPHAFDDQMEFIDAIMARFKRLTI